MQKLLTLNEVAQELRISTRTLYLWIKQGKIKAIKLPSGKLRIESTELERILKESQVSNTVVYDIITRFTKD